VSAPISCRQSEEISTLCCFDERRRKEKLPLFLLLERRDDAFSFKPLRDSVSISVPLSLLSEAARILIPQKAQKNQRERKREKRRTKKAD
jgi:hypothetical protein